MGHTAFSDYMDTFANNLRVLIDSHGLTAKALSDESGIPDATIYRYLHKDRAPKLDNVIALAQFFDVSVDWLIGISDGRREGWTPSVVNAARLYSAASPDDRRVVDAVLEKYKEE